MKHLLLALASAMAAIGSLQADPLPVPLQSTLDQYIQIQTALASDSLAGVPAAAAGLAAAAKASDGVVPEDATRQAEALAKTTDIQAAREAFKQLSATLIATLSAQKAKTGQYYEAFCPMAKASWIQTGQKIANPYFGTGMSDCGEIRQALLGAPQANSPGARGSAPACSGCSNSR
jgi:hypothetical protein